MGTARLAREVVQAAQNRKRYLSHSYRLEVAKDPSLRFLYDQCLSGAKVDEKTNGGLTPLMITALTSHPEMIRLLLEKGADANIQDGYGNTAIVSAAARGPMEYFKLLLNATSKPQLDRR